MGWSAFSTITLQTMWDLETGAPTMPAPFYRSSMEMSLENSIEIDGKVFLYTVILNTLAFLLALFMANDCFFRNSSALNVTSSQYSALPK